MRLVDGARVVASSAAAAADALEAALRLHQEFLE
jgi:hypothetical protein